jgi:serine/threonine-protein kinase
MSAGFGDSGRLAALGPGSLLGKYELLREIGHGGMGIVFEAKDTWLGRRVAIKVLSQELVSSPDARKRFLKEGQTAVSFPHKNVVTIHDLGESDGYLFLVMEYLQGETLGVRLGREKRLSVAETLALLGPVLDAVAAAHAQGIIHRDLKPDNIFVVPGPDGLRPVVLDFGIAKALGETTQTATGQIVGTPLYMSPEQAGAVKGLIGEPTDQYALGAIIYECVAGRHPLGESVRDLSMMEMLGQVVNALPDPLAAVAPDAGAPFSMAVMKMLAKAPDARFRSVREAKLELEASAQLGSQPAAPAPRLSPVGGTVALPAGPRAAAQTVALEHVPPAFVATPRTGPRWPWWLLSLVALGVALGLALAAFALWHALRPEPADGRLGGIAAPPASRPSVVPTPTPTPTPAPTPPAAIAPAPPAAPVPAPPAPPVPAAAERSPATAPATGSPVTRVKRKTAVPQRPPAAAPTGTTAAPAGAAPAAVDGVPLVPDIEVRQPVPVKEAAPQPAEPPVRRRANDAPVIR